MKTQRVAVNSAAIESVGYNGKKAKLHIVFTSGGRYVYDEVPSEVALSLVNANSIGRYFVREIRNVYAFSRKGV